MDNAGGWAGLGWAGWAEPGTGNCCYHSNCLLQLGTMDTGIVLCLILQLVNTGPLSAPSTPHNFILINSQTFLPQCHFIKIVPFSNQQRAAAAAQPSLAWWSDDDNMIISAGADKTGHQMAGRGRGRGLMWWCCWLMTWAGGTSPCLATPPPGPPTLTGAVQCSDWCHVPRVQAGHLLGAAELPLLRLPGVLPLPRRAAHR